MNKEKIITIVIGLTVGAIVTGGYFALTNFLPRLQKKDDKIIVQPKPKNTESPILGNTNLNLALTSPNDRSSTRSATLLVSGTTAPAATVVIFGNAEEKIASGDATGNFSATLKLEPGENDLSVTAFANKINSQVIHRTVMLEINP